MGKFREEMSGVKCIQQWKLVILVWMFGYLIATRFKIKILLKLKIQNATVLYFGTVSSHGCS